MFDPFVFPTRREKSRRKLTAATEESIAQLHGRSAEADSQQQIGLWLGRLLIRMGERLTHQEAELKHAREHA